MTRTTLATGVLLSPGIAAAHPDHFGGPAFSLAHFLTDPFHIAVALTAGLALAAAWRASRRRRPVRRPIR